METFISLNEEKVSATTYLKVVDLQYELRQPDSRFWAQSQKHLWLTQQVKFKCDLSINIKVLKAYHLEELVSLYWIFQKGKTETYG